MMHLALVALATVSSWTVDAFLVPLPLAKNKKPINEKARKLSSVVLPSTRNIDDNDHEYAEFLDKKSLRNAISKNELFSELDTVTKEIIVQESGTVTIEGSKAIFDKGDEADGMYIINSGEVEIVGDEGHLLISLGEGTVFGELGLFNDEPRAATARSSREGASLWKLSASSFDRSLKSSLMETASRNPDYESYMDDKKLNMAMKKCPIFKKFDKDDLQRCASSFEKMEFGNDEILFRQGDDGDAMYFVKSGIFQALSNEGELVTSIGESEYFGELALFFNKPRALSIRAAGEGCAVWKLSQHDFDNAVQQYPLSEISLTLLRTKYDEDTLLNTLKKITRGEFVDLIRLASRPKKQSVSIHSTISSCTTAAAVVLLLPLLAPGFDKFGYVQLFRFNEALSDDLYIQVQVIILFQMIIAVMGIFRLPKNSPRIRVIGMISALGPALQIGLVAISSLNGTGIYLFDAYTIPFKVLCLVSNAFALKSVLDFVDCTVGDVDTKGWDSVPGASNRFVAVLFSVFFLASFVILEFQAYLPLLGIKEESLAYTEAYSATCGGAQTAGLLATELYIGLGALLGTLQFERKISQETSLAIWIFLTVALLGDGLKLTYLVNAAPDVVPNAEYLTEYIPNLASIYHPNEFGIGLLGLTIVNALRRLWVDTKKSESGEIN